MAAISTRLPFVWDYDLDETQFTRLLSGELTLGRLDRTWAAVRLLEHAPYRDIVRLMGFRDLVRGWPDWRMQEELSDLPGRRADLRAPSELSKYFREEVLAEAEELYVETG